MKKKLLTENITNELEGSSLFFTRPSPPPPLATVPTKSEVIPEPQSPFQSQPVTETGEPEKPKSHAIPENKNVDTDTMTPRYHDTTPPRYHASKQARIHGVVIDIVRKAVKEFGKEAATHRFTALEKKELADLIYTQKSQGVRTSENEITRIAVNFIIEDYKENGENSVLHIILAALNE